jgi:tRNA-Thr(GGU) m(6)t(6)A37 methyltransferase TsaA
VHQTGLEPELINNHFDAHELGKLVFEDSRDNNLEQAKSPENMNIEYKAIGEFKTELTRLSGAPRQGALDPENKGIIEIFPDYEQAMQDLEHYDYIIVLYHMHFSTGWRPLVRPPASSKDFGLFATRSPNRPNSIGFGVIRLEKVDGRFLHVSGVDAFDGTPVLDIKPWLPSIDCPDRNASLQIETELGIKQ